MRNTGAEPGLCVLAKRSGAVQLLCKLAERTEILGNILTADVGTWIIWQVRMAVSSKILLLRKFYFKSLKESNTEEMDGMCKLPDYLVVVIKMDLYNLYISPKGYMLFMRIQINLCLVLNEFISMSL